MRAHDAGDVDDEEPEVLVGRQLQQFAEERRRREDVRNMPLNGTPLASASSTKRGLPRGWHSRAAGCARLNGCRADACSVSGSRRKLAAGAAPSAASSQKIDAPRLHEQHAADQRRDGRATPRQRHLRHHRCASVGGTCPDHRARTTMPAPVASPAGREGDQLAPGWSPSRSRPTRPREQRAAEDHRPAAEAVGQRAVEQVHEGEAEQVGPKASAAFAAGWPTASRRCRQCRQVGVDREPGPSMLRRRAASTAPSAARSTVGRVRVHGGWTGFAGRG